MNYDDLIKKWHIKASEEDYFSKYVFEYLAFIATLRKKGFTSAGSDRKAIQLLKQNEHLRKLYLGQVEHNAGKIKEAWKTIIEELNISPLGNVSRTEEVREIGYWNCSHDAVGDKTEEERAKLSGVIHSVEDWENMVEFWYSIRNNFFHGGKDPEDRRDQLLIKNGFITLKLLVKMMIYDDAIFVSAVWE